MSQQTLAGKKSLLRMKKMAYRFYNPNPEKLMVGDCIIRGVAKLTNKSWDEIYIDLVTYGFKMKDLPDSNVVLGAYLYANNYRRHVIPNTCPDCYSISQFAEDHPHGKFLLATGVHVVAVVDGDYYDTWDSGNEVPVYFWEKETIKWR